MKLLRSLSIASSLLAAATSAQALTFTFVVAAGDTLTADQSAAFSTAAAAWSAILTDNFTVNLKIGFRSLATGVLGQTYASFVQGPASVVSGLLTLDAKSADDATAVASLSNLSPSGLVVLTSAQARALGEVVPGGDDGTIEFSSNYAFSTSRNSDGTIAAGTYDLIGIAEHEIAHVLAFDSSIDLGLANPTLLDEFRYSAAGVRSLTAGSAAYFSIDGGVTGINDFAVGGSGNDQASHWKRGTGALMDPAIAPGATQNITALDRRALDVLGYDLATNVPEPGTMALLLPFSLATVWVRRRGC